MSGTFSRIDVLDQGIVAISPGETWKPVVGEETLRFLDKLPEEAREKIRAEAYSILARGTPPTARGSRAGLVVGYVQSGKTMSFTAAAAMARDNGFPMVIVIAGTSDPLLDQTRRRLSIDLELSNKDAYRRWIEVRSPAPDSDACDQMAAALEEWLTEGRATDRATLLVTVMKQHRHLDRLSGVLRELGRRLDLARIPTIIVDDEADQASPNVSSEAGGESATYSRIRRVRHELPSHTLLQYTATPQATLLVSIVDEISPDFVCVIEPGSDYTGGKYFFQDHHATFIRHIPQADLTAVDGSASAPPLSLLRAFAFFALTAAVGIRQPEVATQRSMLVHPSHKTLPHAQFVGWLKAARDVWTECLEARDDSDSADVLADFIVPAYNDLASSVVDLPPLDELLDRLPMVLKKIRIETVNSQGGKFKPIPWSTGYAWVLVGGQLLDRGFTVEGLTVTYMPRPVGVGNLDTLQQRGRFFGYKRAYAAHCRAWMDPQVDQAFTGYVDHEERMRSDLRKVAEEGESLRNWKRVFFLDRRMKLTRASVIRLSMLRQEFREWFPQTWLDPSDEDVHSANAVVVDAFLPSASLSDMDAHPLATEPQRHKFADVPLGALLEPVLMQFVMAGDDAKHFTALRVLLEKDLEEYPSRLCRVVAMGPQGSTRDRSLAKDSPRIKNLMQGANANTGYAGDRAQRSEELVTIQFYKLNLRRDDGSDEGSRGQLLAKNVPALAIWLPARLRTSAMIEDR